MPLGCSVTHFLEWTTRGPTFSPLIPEEERLREADDPRGETFLPSNTILQSVDPRGRESVKQVTVTEENRKGAALSL